VIEWCQCCPDPGTTHRPDGASREARIRRPDPEELRPWGHTITLAEARERARQARQQLLDGVDPINARDEKRATSPPVRLLAGKDIEHLGFEANSIVFAVPILSLIGENV